MGEAAYDWLVLGRVVNQGYEASQITDYAGFIIPLLCLGGVFAIRSRFGRPLGAFAVIMTIGLTLLSIFYASEAYVPHIPGGLLFMAPGLLLHWIGALFFALRLFHQSDVPRVLKILSVALFGSNSILFIVPFFYGMMDKAWETPLTVGSVMVIGFVWMCLGKVMAAMDRSVY